MERKFMLCQYPDNGFGPKNGQLYLLDVFGNKYDIINEYDKTLDEMNKVVTISDEVHGTFCASSIKELIAQIELYTDTKIEKW
jgi:hypothetical protein